MIKVIFAFSILVLSNQCWALGSANYNAAERTVAKVYDYAASEMKDYYRSLLTEEAFDSLGKEAGMKVLADEVAGFRKFGVKSSAPSGEGNSKLRRFSVQVAGKNLASWSRIRVVEVQCIYEGSRPIPCTCVHDSFLCGATCGYEPIYSDCLVTKLK